MTIKAQNITKRFGDFTALDDVGVEVVLVDNGCTDGGVDVVRDFPGVTVVDPGRNLGLDAACAVGIAAGSGDFVALVNRPLRRSASANACSTTRRTPTRVKTAVSIPTS